MSKPLTLTGGSLADPLRQPQTTNFVAPNSNTHTRTTHKQCCNNHNNNQHQHNTPPPTSMKFTIPLALEDRKFALFHLIKIGSFDDLQKLAGYMKENDGMAIFSEMRDEGGHTLAHWAMRRGDVKLLDYLWTECQLDFTKPSAEPDSVHMYPIHWASTEGAIAPISWLLQQNLDKEKDVIDVKDSSGCTPMLIASQYGHTTLVAFLIHKGADVNALDKNRDSALHWGAYKGNVNIVGLFCHLDVIPLDSVDSYGQSPLHLASLRGNDEVVQYLLYDAGSKAFHVKDKEGKTPKDLAIKKNKKTTTIILEGYEKYILANRSLTGKVLFSIKEMVSPSAWKVWFMGGATGAVGGGENNRLPFLIVLFNYALVVYIYVSRLFTTEHYGIMADKASLHLFTIAGVAVGFVMLLFTYKTNPGILESGGPNRRGHYCKSSVDNILSEKTKVLQAQYDTVIEKMGQGIDPQKLPQLCHSCHIVKPYRSKHCRVSRRCVLMFDHYCPFVGNCIGLYNYRYFYLFVLFTDLWGVSLLNILYIYLQRIGKEKLIIASMCYLAVWMLMLVPFLYFHTKQVLTNITTNEGANAWRYQYMRNSSTGQFRNPFNRGWMNNITSRLFPDDYSYTLSVGEEEEIQLTELENSEWA